MVNKENYYGILKETEELAVGLIAVSKFKSIEDIQMLYDLGHRDFGENYVQELVEKQKALPKDIRWHFIGNLQRNKVKDIAPFIHLIHGVDSFRLFKEINKQGLRQERSIDCLLQIHIAEEETKFGMDEKELVEFFQFYETGLSDLKNVRIKGLMGMSTFTEDKDQVREEFKRLKTIYKFTKNSYFIGKDYFQEISMGMSGDYKIALEEGSTLIRVGSLIFGNR